MVKRILINVDWPLVIFAFIMTIVGLLNLYSATYNLPVAKYFQSQLIWVSLGVTLMIVTAAIPYEFFSRFAYLFYFIIVVMLVVVLVAGKKAGGSTRWLSLAGINVQPSELMKLMIIIVLAKHFNNREDMAPYGLIQLLVPTILVAVPMGLIFMQPDLGTTLTLAITAFSMLIFVGIHRRTLITLATSALVAIPIAWFFFLSDYQKGRVVTFANPEKYHLAGGYQVIQSKIAVGSGMLTGKGFLEGSQSKLMFLPKQYTDFVFSNFAEEWGFVGSAFMIFVFAFFVFAGFQVAQRAKDRLGELIAIGVSVFFFWHFIINIGMELGLLPVVGLPLPFMSYGGSVTVTSFIGVGLLLNVSIRKFLF